MYSPESPHHLEGGHAPGMHLPKVAARKQLLDLLRETRPLLGEVARDDILKRTRKLSGDGARRISDNKRNNGRLEVVAVRGRDRDLVRARHSIDEVGRVDAIFKVDGRSETRSAAQPSYEV